MYRNAQVALLTQHGKQRVIAPVLVTSLSCRITPVDGFDTDSLGTFTRDIPRAGKQLEAARKKARIGMELSGLPLGLASEGAFGTDPFAGLFPWNVEMIVFFDAQRDLEIMGTAQGKASFAHLLRNRWEDVEAFARKMEFPQQQLVIRPETENDPRLRKGIASWQELETAFAWAVSQSANGQVFVETDGRAHANPTRMDTIGLAAEYLVKKLLSLCPACGTPGYWIVDRIAGLPCAMCGEPTRETSAEIYQCRKCNHHEERSITERPYADPGCCDVCNP